MKYVVLDTNVVVSAMISHLDHGHPAALMQRMAERKFVPVYSTALIEEYEEVLRRPKFKFSDQDIAMVLAMIRRFGIHQERLPGLAFVPACADADDQPFYDLALSTDALLVTGNTKHFPEDKRIFTPNSYFQTLRPEAR